MPETRLVKLGNLAAIVRSKNAGPYRLTLDALFDRDDLYSAVSKSKSLTRESVARAYGVDPSMISSFFEVPVARAFKVTFVRPHAQCSLGESDVYGMQQHVPLMNMLIPVPSSISEYHDV
ncbi:DUF4387 domain-containing protein [Bradyrhizobium zhanjiangense]|uniref:DUF4387 domain-containing protein n=1 Tax=Bradyrhizobium zhanjiangense TaxID=1325107 RepID=A0ABY0D8K5_9BRAD|nr:DUF4387 domain-containing protein [Bradyrhizobium zhanjiangense]RXG85303.1 DUF4387 domain-containing protein [Bradyrhizobium zhanjiangense]